MEARKGCSLDSDYAYSRFSVGDFTSSAASPVANRVLLGAPPGSTPNEVELFVGNAAGAPSVYLEMFEVKCSRRAETTEFESRATILRTFCASSIGPSVPTWGLARVLLGTWVDDSNNCMVAS